MAWSSLFAVTIASLFYVVLPCAALAIDQQYLSAAPHVFRYATVDDADDIATTYVDAFASGPAYDYVHQFHDKYPDADWQCIRLGFRRVIESRDFVCTVIAVPDERAPSGSRVVSFSAWDFNRTHGYGESVDSLGRASCSPPRDRNATRAKDVEERMSAAEREFLDDVYERHVYLGGLATHPTWDGNGFAATHLRWGLAAADRLGLPATLTGTPAGHPLYRSMGYEDVYNLTIPRLDGKGEFWYEVMARPV